MFDASTDRLAPLYILAVYTGCGSGELLRLKWDDINFEAGTQRDRQAFERQKLGDSYTDHGLVCAMALGTPLARDNMTKRLGRVQKAASISSARPFHTLRHDNATLTLLAGVTPKTTADRLGHHSPAVTLERYTHAVRALDDDAADRLQASLTQVRRKAAGAS